MTLLHRLRQLEHAVNGDACPACGYDPSRVRYDVTFATADESPAPLDGIACAICGHVAHYSVGVPHGAGDAGQGDIEDE